MLLTRKSPLTGKINTLDIPALTQDMLDRYAAGALIQNAMPALSASEREFVMTGYTQSDWDAIFPKGDED